MAGRAETYGDRALWFRAVYAPLIRERRLVAAVRPGDRSDPAALNGLPRGVLIPIRIIRRPGFQSAGIPPELEPDDGTEVIITDCLVKRICELAVDDLCGCSPDAASSELIPWHLGLIYDRPFASEDLVTIWRFRYHEAPHPPSV